MKLLIYGSNGWIGKQFITLCNTKTYYPPNKINITIIEGKSRLDDIDSVSTELDTYTPDRVISFTGRTHGTTDDGKYWSTIDYLEQPNKLVDNVRDNLFSVVMLAIACKERNIHYTYLGTGCIFKYIDNVNLSNINIDNGSTDNGSKDNVSVYKFKEDDKPNFTGSSYSIVKGFTDMIMNSKYFKNNVLNLRIRMPINDKCEPRNFITKITRYQKVCSIPNSMTVFDDLLPVMLDMVINKYVGTFNFTNPGVITHNEILELYKEIVDRSFTWVNFTQDEQLKVLSADRSNNYLDTSKLEEYYPDLLDIKTSIKLTLTSYAKHWNTLPDTEKYWKQYN